MLEDKNPKLRSKWLRFRPLRVVDDDEMAKPITIKMNGLDGRADAVIVSNSQLAEPDVLKTVGKLIDRHADRLATKLACLLRKNGVGVWNSISWGQRMSTYAWRVGALGTGVLIKSWYDGRLVEDLSRLSTFLFG
jgi:hypothetical protein